MRTSRPGYHEVCPQYPSARSTSRTAEYTRLTVRPPRAAPAVRRPPAGPEAEPGPVAWAGVPGRLRPDDRRAVGRPAPGPVAVGVAGSSAGPSGPVGGLPGADRGDHPPALARRDATGTAGRGPGRSSGRPSLVVGER